MMPACPHSEPAPPRPREIAASHGFGPLPSAPAIRRATARFFCLETPWLWKSSAPDRRPAATTTHELSPTPVDALRP